MPKLVGFIFGALAGLIGAAGLFGGSTWGPGFTAKEAATQGSGAPQFKLSSETPAARPTGDPAPSANAAPPQPTSDQSPPNAQSTNGAAPAPFNTGGNPDVEVGAGPNWGLGLRLGRTGK
jgi:hypothetical protein